MFTRSSITKSVLSAATLLALSTQAHALVEAGHWTLTNGSPGGVDIPGNTYTTIDQTPDGDYTGILSNYLNGVITGISYNVDEGSDLFVVQKGAVFSNETVISQNLPFLHGVSVFESGWTPGSATVGQEFYLGARTRTNYQQGFFDTFGWAHFKVNAAGQLTLLDSAVAFNEGGIVVGTLQAVPEPSTYALMGIGLLALAGATRANKARQARG